jgi:hypothetical protein
MHSLVARGEELDAVDVWALSWTGRADLWREVYRVGDLRESAGDPKVAVHSVAFVTHSCSCGSEGRRTNVSAPLTSVPTRTRSRHGGYPFSLANTVSPAVNALLSSGFLLPPAALVLGFGRATFLLEAGLGLDAGLEEVGAGAGAGAGWVVSVVSVVSAGAEGSAGGAATGSSAIALGFQRCLRGVSAMNSTEEGWMSSHWAGKVG